MHSGVCASKSRSASHTVDATVGFCCQQKLGEAANRNDDGQCGSALATRPTGAPIHMYQPTVAELNTSLCVIQASQNNPRRLCIVYPAVTEQLALGKSPEVLIYRTLGAQKSSLKALNLLVCQLLHASQQRTLLSVTVLIRRDALERSHMLCAKVMSFSKVVIANRSCCGASDTLSN